MVVWGWEQAGFGEEGRITKRHKESLEGDRYDRYVHYLDCGHGFMVVYIF